ncbi:glycoside hydrolase family 16 protein [Thalassotalea ponticola]|uniref:glycoside hydrolase family 16 protein n=1 Tax=Thalassotalea ponticola TaxID=1523392 RepID=UPI0033901631
MKRFSSLFLLSSVTLVSAHAADFDEASAKQVYILNAEDAQEKHDAWQLVWQDEFNNAQIDDSKWSFEVNCFGGGNNEQQCYTDRKVNAYIDNGQLVINAQQETYSGPALHDDHPSYAPTTLRELPFTSARLRSKGKGDWRYGRFEIRAKLPFGQGSWPAIWMLPTDWVYGSWASSGEIDIMEAVNLKAPSDAPGEEPNTPESRIHGTLHYGGVAPDNVYTGVGVKLPNLANPADGFHTYAVEWEQGEIRWYVDDIHFATQTAEHWYSKTKDALGDWQMRDKDAPFDQRFHLLLNLAVGGAWPENVNNKGIDNSVFPQQMRVDYVRVYQCSIDPETGKGCAQINPHAKLVK